MKDNIDTIHLVKTFTEKYQLAIFVGNWFSTKYHKILYKRVCQHKNTYSEFWSHELKYYESTSKIKLGEKYIVVFHNGQILSLNYLSISK